MQSEATQLLRARSAEFEKDVIHVADGLYTAVGFGVSTISMIIGDDGLIIIDTGIDGESAENVIAAFRKISNLPIRAIILTHGHMDHVGGLGVFLKESPADLQVWARENYQKEDKDFASVGIRFQRKRGGRQAGFLLPPEKRINNGVARAYYPTFARKQKAGGKPQGKTAGPPRAPNQPIF